MKFDDRKREIRFTLCMLLLFSLCQSCVVMKIRNELPTGMSKEPANFCEIKYSISVSSNLYTNTFGKQNEKNDQVRKLKDQYIESTKQVLDKKGCVATYSQDEQNVDIKIHVTRQLQLSAFPQEWLCGLSLGVIPAWATREGEFLYTFDKTGLNIPYTYYIDTVRYCHILLLPFGFKPIYADEFKT